MTVEIDINEDPEENRMLADHIVDTYTHGMRHLMEVNASASRWITTSLLAINGAAAIAILGQPMPQAGKLLSCSLLSLGVLCALGSAHLGIKAGAKLLGPMGEALGYWINVKHDGYRISKLEGHEDALAKMIREAAKPSMVLGYLSVFLFAAGLISSALAMTGMI